MQKFPLFYNCTQHQNDQIYAAKNAIYDHKIQLFLFHLTTPKRQNTIITIIQRSFRISSICFGISKCLAKMAVCPFSTGLSLYTSRYRESWLSWVMTVIYYEITVLKFFCFRFFPGCCCYLTGIREPPFLLFRWFFFLPCKQEKFWKYVIVIQ